MSSLLEQTIDAIATDMGATGYTVFGEHDRAKRMTAPRVSWQFVGVTPTDSERQEGDGDTVVYTAPLECDVELWAAAGAGQTDFEVWEALYKSFLASAANVVGEDVLSIGRAIPVREAKHVSKGVTTHMPVRVRFPVYAEQLASHKILTTALAASVTDPNGSDGETAP